MAYYSTDLTIYILELFKLRLDELHEYVTTVEEAIESKLNKFEEALEIQLKEIDENNRESFFNFHSDTAWNLIERFPNTARRSAFVTVYSLFEHYLISTAKAKKREIEFGDKEKDPNYDWTKNLRQNSEQHPEIIKIKNDGIDGAKEFLKNECNINFPSHSQEWMEIKIYSKIRNFIVHHDSEILDPKNSQKTKTGKVQAVRDYVSKHSDIEIDDRDRIQLKEGFCPKVIDTMKSFSEELCSKLQE